MISRREIGLYVVLDAMNVLLLVPSQTLVFGSGHVCSDFLSYVPWKLAILSMPGKELGTWLLK